MADTTGVTEQVRQGVYILCMHIFAGNHIIETNNKKPEFMSLYTFMFPQDLTHPLQNQGDAFSIYGPIIFIDILHLKYYM